MKTFTPPLTRFALVAVLSTAGFRILLSGLLNNASFKYIIPLALLYAIVLFATGWHFGKKDGDYLPIHDVGFRFHLITFIQYQIITYACFFLGKPSRLEHVGQLNPVLVIWGFFLCLHFYYYLKAKKNTIKQIRRDDIFE